MSGGLIAADPKIDPFLIRIKRHIAAGLYLGRRRSQNFLIKISRFEVAGFAVGKKLFKIDLNDLK